MDGIVLVFAIVISGLIGAAIGERRSSKGGAASKDAVRKVSRKGRLVGHAAAL
jgi:hypothetical protein